MGFIVLLMAAATAIAGAAAYFSVYGLAYTFSGVFWSVVVMGASLEAGKLVAASYLYRYWDRTGWILKTYLISGVIALMVLTSTGIFGYLSTGYQQDVLPLKQKQQQVQLLEAEKSRALNRKQQIDEIIAGNSSTAASAGTGANAARILRETNRGRDQVSRQFREEQKEVTQRVAQLDKELLALKQDLVQAEAHIGPIMFVAQAFNMGADDATKWLIFLIIFAFDPMAVALTLAVNIALRLHKEDLEKAKQQPEVVPVPLPEPEPEDPPKPEPEVVVAEEPNDAAEPEHHAFPVLDPIHENVQDDQLVVMDIEEQAPDVIESVADVVQDPVDQPVDLPEIIEPEVVSPPPAHTNLSHRFAGFLRDPSMTKINELVSHLRYLKERQLQGFQLTDVETWELQTIEDILRKHGYDKYM